MHGRLFVLLSGLILLAGLGACKKEEGSAVPPPVVWTVAPQKMAMTAALELTGQVVAPRQSALGFQVPGRIVERRVEVGDRIRAGQVLMTLDDRDYRLKVDNIEAQLAATASDLQTAKRDLRRLQDLLQRKLVSQQQVDNARNLVTKLQAQLNALEPQLAQARNQLAYTRLKAPYDGVVTARQADVGQVVGAGTPVVSVAADERVAQFDWPETAGRPPRQATLILGSTSISATLDYVAPTADPASRTFVVRYRLKPGAASPGRSVQLRAKATGEPLWRVPATALRMEKGHAFLLRVTEGRIQPVEVAVVRMDSDHAWVHGALRSDMPIVAMGVHVLTGGQKVRAKSDG